MKVTTSSQLAEQELKIEQLEVNVRSLEEGIDKAKKVLDQAYCSVINE
jgi:hypothetical protein